MIRNDELITLTAEVSLWLNQMDTALQKFLNDSGQESDRSASQASAPPVSRADSQTAAAVHG